MDNDSHRRSTDERGEDKHGGILRRLEEKLDRLLGHRDDDWHGREWAPPGDPRPRIFETSPSSAGPRFHRIDVGSVGSDGVDPDTSLDPEPRPFYGVRSSAREYYLAMRAREQARAKQRPSPYADYRRRREAELDREYADYCEDRQACFDRDFDAWRQKRAGPAPPVDEPSQAETAGKQKVESR